MEISQLFKLCIDHQASDLHIAPGSPPICRINGDLVIMTEHPALSADTAKKMILGLMSKEQLEIFSAKLQLDFIVLAGDLGNFRVNAFHQANGIAAVFRFIPALIPTLEDLNMPEVVKKLLNLTSGLILVSGPTGSGKSTSLAAMVEYINTNQSRHVITIEDPIEFIHQSKKSLITQRQIYRDVHNFSEALRAALREDPNVILIGEMRDLETIRLALTAAETGHLVLGTLHTSSAPHAVNRIIDVFPVGEKNMIRNLLSESLQAILCQMLVSNTIGKRIAAFEIMLGTPAIRNCIREDKIAQMYSVIQTGSQKGMCTMEQYMKSLVEKNILSSVIADEKNLQRNIFEDTDAY